MNLRKINADSQPAAELRNRRQARSSSSPSPPPVRQTSRDRSSSSPQPPQQQLVEKRSGRQPRVIHGLYNNIYWTVHRFISVFRREVLTRKRTSFMLGLVVGSLMISMMITEDNRFRTLTDMETLKSILSAQLKNIMPANPEFMTEFTAFISENLIAGGDSQLPGHTLVSEGASAHFPVFMIPGIVSTNLESWARGGCAEAYFRKKIWGDLTMASSLLLDKSCWLHNLLLDPDTGLDPPSAKIRAVQGLDAANYFMPGYWVWAKIMENLALVGYDSNTMHLASYDWRLLFQNLEVRDSYFSKLRSNLELSFRISGRKAVILSHSMGGNVVHYFLKWVESPSQQNSPGWVDKYIHAIVDIACPYLGVPKTIPSILSGEMRDTAQLGWLSTNLLERFFTKRERSAIFRSWAGVSTMLPKGGEALWGNGTVEYDISSDEVTDGSFVRFQNIDPDSPVTHRNYTANTFLDLLKTFTGGFFERRLENDLSHGIKMRDLDSAEMDQPKYWNNVLEHALPLAPDMTIYTFYGVGKPAERSYMFALSECDDHQIITKDGHVEELTSDIRLDNADGTTLIQAQKKKVCTKSTAQQHSNETVKFDDILPFVNISHSLGIDTEMTIPSSDLHSGVQDTDGDGTVPLLSLGYMPVAGWRKDGYGHIYNPSNIPVVAREYKHEPVTMVKDARGGPKTGDHVDILGNHEMTEDILRIVTNRAETVKDRIYSKIRQIAKQVKLQEIDL